MEKLKLIEPSIVYKDDIIDYRQEFLDNNDSMDGTANLRNIESIEIWLDNIIANSSESTVKDGLVPASTYLAIRICDDYIVGMIDIRHRLNEYLMNFGGHIGYSVRKSERLKGYAKEMLRLGIEKCKELDVENILVTCDKTNIGSSKTIVFNGGILENEITEEGSITQRYWIKL